MKSKLIVFALFLGLQAFAQQPSGPNLDRMYEEAQMGVAQFFEGEFNADATHFMSNDEVLNWIEDNIEQAELKEKLREDIEPMLELGAHAIYVPEVHIDCYRLKGAIYVRPHFDTDPDRYRDVGYAGSWIYSFCGKIKEPKKIKKYCLWCKKDGTICQCIKTKDKGKKCPQCK